MGVAAVIVVVVPRLGGLVRSVKGLGALEGALVAYDGLLLLVRGLGLFEDAEELLALCRELVAVAGGWEWGGCVRC